MNMLDKKGTCLVVHLPAELDHHYTEEIRRKVDTILKEEPINKVEFDFSETMFMDSAGIGMILGRYKLMNALDGKIVMTNMSGQIRRILSLSGIQKYIQLNEEETI